jgi:CRISPR-associated endonuclease Csn1
MDTKQDLPDGVYLLGLDIGVQSVGWAVIDLDRDGNPCRLRRTGVRCFDSGVGSETQVEMGKDEPPGAKRRQARQQRRQLWRRAQRQRRVFRTLQEAALLPAGSPDAQSRDRILRQLDQELAAQHGSPGDPVAAHLLPYRLRAKALDEPLSPHALGRAIYHLAQRRGFLSNKKAQKDSEEQGKVKAGIAQLHKEMQAAKARTLGEYLAGLDPEERRIRGRWTARQMYVDEFDAIWAAQAPHNPALADGAKAKIRRAIFFQRPLKSQKGLIGRCDLEPRHRRAPLASLVAQRFRYWQKINDLEIIEPEGLVRPLSPQEREKLAAALETQGEMSFGGMRTVLGLKKPKGSKENFEFNLERGGEKKIPGNRTATKMAAALAARWEGMKDDDQQRLVAEILSFENEDALAKRLARAWALDEAAAVQVAALDFESGYAALSARAMRRLLPLMQSAMRYATARKQVYGDNLGAERVHDSLPPIRKAVPSLRNPGVSRALTEVRKVVNALIRAYGKPATVRIELARDMKRGRKQREETWKTMRENEKVRDAARDRLAKERAIQEPRPGDILKVRLAEECNWECPYTGRQICMDTLVGFQPQFDVEHIIPFARSLDNSFVNKTLCYHEENRNVKQNRTPFEAYRTDQTRWPEILKRVRRFRGSASEAKLRKFQLQEIDEDFTSRHLNDTRYASRLAADYVGLLFGGRCDETGRLRIQVGTGGTTGYLRDEWGLNAVLSDRDEKERTDHRHHAVDAVVIALTGPGTVHDLTRAALRAKELGRRLFVPIDPPWGSAQSFLADVRRSVDAITVSYRVDRKVSGALHKDSNYSEPHHAADATGKAIEVRHIRKLLEKMSSDEVESIVDDRIRNLVKAKLDQIRGEPKKVFADRANHPYTKTADGRLIPIHKARIRETVGTIAVGPSEHARYVAPGSNHHMEILGILDEEGNVEESQGVLVTLYEAAHRVRAHERVIKRDHGSGKKFLFSLAGSEYVEMEHKPGQRQLFRVTVISEKQIEFRLHTDARPITVLKKIPGARVRRSPASLLEAKARKVAIDPLGNVLPAND